MEILMCLRRGQSSKDYHLSSQSLAIRADLSTAATTIATTAANIIILIC